MSLFESINQRLSRRKEKVIATVDREKYQLEGSFFDPDKLPQEKYKSPMRVISGVESLSRKSGIKSDISYDSGEAVIAPQRDPGKRQRIFVIAGAVVLFVFGLRAWGNEEWGVLQMIEVALGAGILTYLGLMWALRFEVIRTGYMSVLPLPTLFVVGYVLFVELFFFVRFQRIYEAVLFGVLLILFYGGLIVAFLTANVLNVATLRKIPLLQVAHTASYVITLFSSFFLAYFVISLGLSIYLTTAIFTILFFLAVFFHLSHFGIRQNRVIWYSVAIALLASDIAYAMMLWPVDTMFRVLLPTMTIYVGVGIVMHDAKHIFRTLIYWEYFLIFLLVLVIIMITSEWGIAGKVWM